MFCRMPRRLLGGQDYEGVTNIIASYPAPVMIPGLETTNVNSRPFLNARVKTKTIMNSARPGKV
jgi:hypothetical protein